MLRLRLGNCVTKVAPKYQNHEIPRIDRNTVRFSRRKRKLRQVSVTGFQLILSEGSGAGDSGMKRLSAKPPAEIATVAAATPATPHPASLTIQPPMIIPARIAIAVPVSTSPLPPI